ncbi:CCA tRNA nucleotidyltransferase [Novipirellula galeiformis]|uniref:CCA tRNA nucleotidyltransferase n=1 Tax=Novipirellula galeiformis TaxID=2528004 RepID=UPI0011B58118|nr:CCA tRNA nucleotidyltransferase [Novipirellula galeiformis]
MNPTCTPFDFDFSTESAQEALRVIRRLRAAGFTAYLAGGCVRDALLNKHPKDYDVATDATPESICDVFGRKRTLAFGASFGVIGVLPDRKLAAPRKRANAATEHGEEAAITKVEPTEVATFRSDGVYLDGRRPDSVHFGNAAADAQRRDFTINGLFYDPAMGQIIDYVSGHDDLKRGVLRTIGDPDQRFGEDKLRMLRAVRFATTIDFEIEPRTAQSIRDKASEIVRVSGERIGIEMRRTMSSENAYQGFEHLRALSLAAYVLPELENMDGDRLAQYFAHKRRRSFPSALACLLLASEHALADLRSIAKRWKLSNEEKRIVTAAIHGAPVLSIAHKLAWSKVQPVLIDRDIAVVLDVASECVRATGLESDGIQLVQKALSLPAMVLDPAPLLTGSDLAGLEIPAGPAYAKILSHLRNQQLDGVLQTRDDAIRELRKHRWN